MPAICVTTKVKSASTTVTPRLPVAVEMPGNFPAMAGIGKRPVRFMKRMKKPAPVPESDKPRATEHGVTLGKEEAATGAHGARQRPGEHGGGAKEEAGIAEDIFHHVTDEVWVPLGFWIGAHHVDLSI